MRIVHFLTSQRTDIHCCERWWENCALLKPIGNSTAQYIDAVVAHRSEARDGD
jgi:hypothetical protein